MIASNAAGVQFPSVPLFQGLNTASNEPKRLNKRTCDSLAVKVMTKKKKTKKDNQPQGIKNLALSFFIFLMTETAINAKNKTVKIKM